MNDKIDTEKLAKRLLECDILFKWQPHATEYAEAHVEEVYKNAMKVRYTGQPRTAWIDTNHITDIIVLREKNV